MYSTRIEELGGGPIEFGTSGLLYRSNKLMYDRATNTLWRQFVGEPVVGPLANSGIKLEVFPVTVTTWAAWSEMHPDTTVLSQHTGVYPAGTYLPETNPRAIYYDYFARSDTMFPVWLRDDALPTKESVLGVLVRGVPLNDLIKQRFSVGEVVMEGIRLCQPCKYLARIAGEPGVLPGLVNRGGLRARILSEGVIRVGDTVRPAL